MAATLTLLSILEGEFHIAHVGDSRAYLFREGRLQQITHDHSVAFEQYWVGAITKEDIRNHPNQNLLTRTLGGGDLVTPDFWEGRLEPGDRFLLCSDGLTKELSDSEISLILVQRSTPDLTCQKLLERTR
jgi:protein phosphatase